MFSRDPTPNQRLRATTQELPARLQETETHQEVRAFEAIDRDIARSLSEEIAQDNRLGFARSFTHRAATTCWARATMLVPMPALPDGMDCIPLTSEAMRVADQFGAAIADRDPAAAAQLLGTLYITALPETFRASHGIFYTPRELVEHLVQMVEDAGVDWSRACVLDPACGGGAFLLPLARRMVDALRGTDPVFVLQQLGKRLRGFDIDPTRSLARAILS
jgi:adenine-specific DNA-methyltransferase